MQEIPRRADSKNIIPPDGIGGGTRGRMGLGPPLLFLGGLAPPLFHLPSSLSNKIGIGSLVEANRLMKTLWNSVVFCQYYL